MSEKSAVSLTAAEAARKLGVSYATIRKRIIRVVDADESPSPTQTQTDCNHPKGIGLWSRIPIGSKCKKNQSAQMPDNFE